MTEKTHKTSKNDKKVSFLSINSLSDLLADEPAFRLKQVLSAITKPDFTDFMQISSLPLDLRQKLEENFPEPLLAIKNVSTTRNSQSIKALLECQDKEQIESVLIENAKNHYTLCVSTQIGCAVGCLFCATATMGLTRSLNALEIACQLPLWNKYLKDQKIDKRISNIVLMGMGEPLLNYENVKTAVKLWLENSRIGKNHITLSTVGIQNTLETILADEEWPGIRIAISLHAPDPVIRKELIPSQQKDFFDFLKKWSKKYNKNKAGRNNYLTIEYMLIKGVNDSPAHAKRLAAFLNKIPRLKLNLINYNSTTHSDFSKPLPRTVETFQNIMKNKGITTTLRKSLGNEIDAACGQLKVNNNS